MVTLGIINIFKLQKKTLFIINVLSSTKFCIFQSVESSSEKTIPIIQTNQPALKLQEGEAKQENMES